MAHVIESPTTQHAFEVKSRQRFEFGANWRRFLGTLDDQRIENAVQSLQEKLNVTTLAGKTFLDAGSGSGLFSLAAKKLGARVHSFDFDPKSVNCTKELRSRYFANDGDWTIEEASVLDVDYLKSLGRFDVVYSWGVLHHTGSMWQALENICIPVGDQGNLFVSIYNDQGRKSVLWTKCKRVYNALPSVLKTPFMIAVMGPLELAKFAYLSARLKPHKYLQNWTQYKSNRGMSRWHDLVDWIGGYPFEVAKPEHIFRFFADRGFTLKELVTRGGSLGCNEFVFSKTD